MNNAILVYIHSLVRDCKFLVSSYDGFTFLFNRVSWASVYTYKYNQGCIVAMKEDRDMKVLLPARGP